MSFSSDKVSSQLLITLRIWFAFLMITSMSSYYVFRYFDFPVQNQLELAKECSDTETEAENEKEEVELDDYDQALFQNGSCNQSKLSFVAYHFSYLYGFHITIVTPPPERT